MAFLVKSYIFPIKVFTKTATQTNIKPIARLSSAKRRTTKALNKTTLEGNKTFFISLTNKKTNPQLSFKKRYDVKTLMKQPAK